MPNKFIAHYIIIISSLSQTNQDMYTGVNKLTAYNEVVHIILYNRQHVRIYCVNIGALCKVYQCSNLANAGQTTFTHAVF